MSADHHRGRKKQKKGFGIVSTIILIIAIAVFCFAGFQLFKILKGYYDGRSEYKDIEKLAVTTDHEDEQGDGFSVDFDKLKAINPDTIGWIRFDPEPAIINYPIVHTTDNSTYLKKTFSKNENTLGAIFMNTYNNPDFNDKNTIIYGHRMRDGSMFKGLWKYDEKSFYDANPNFYIYTPEGKVYVYTIFAVAQVNERDMAYNIQFDETNTFADHIAQLKAKSMYDTSVEVGADDSIVTLSTCTSASDDNRLAVIGVRTEIRDMPAAKQDQQAESK